MNYDMDGILNDFFKVSRGDLDKKPQSDAAKAAQRDIDAIERASRMTAEQISAGIREMNEALKKDYGIKNTSGDLEATLKSQSASALSSQEEAGRGMTAHAEPGEIEGGVPSGSLDSFDGISQVIKEKVYGQDEFIKKLIIAFKRPYVYERDDNDALNSIFLSGPPCTGKHFTLTTIVEELAKRKILRNAGIYTMDLSLYPTAAEEKLFLQDLYSALQSEAQVIAFEKYEACHVANLAKLSDLVCTGECKLSDRYVMQKGQLINVANSLAGNVVGSFTAKGKYLIFVSNKPIDNLAGAMGAPFVNALGDICTTQNISDEAMRQISDIKEKQLIDKCEKQLHFNISIEAGFREYVLKQSDGGRGLQGILDMYTDTLRALAELRLERDDLPTSRLTLSCDSSPLILAGEEKISLEGLLPGGYSGELDSVKAELESIVGLKEVKDYILSLEEYYSVQKRRREAGLKASEVNKHMIFTGNPGTGKTTIARIVSKYLKAIGVLSGGQLVEVSRGDLVGRYVGHTAPLVNQVIKSALGGVLFIDEAYSLYRGGEDSFGLEAIDTLVKGIEDNRDNLIVILAGYSYEMSEFLEANSGLKSRFPNIINFPDYTGEELLKIAEITAKSKGYVIDEAAKKPLLDFFTRVQETDAREAGNGRLVRNKIEEAILNQSRRLVAEQDADISLLLEMDFEM